MAWCELPIYKCPHCGKEGQLDEYYDYDIDDYFLCSMCEKEIYIHEKAVIMEMLLEKKPHKDSIKLRRDLLGQE